MGGQKFPVAPVNDNVKIEAQPDCGGMILVMSVPQNLLGSIVLGFAFSVEEFRLVARSLRFFGTRSPSAFMRRSTRL